MEQNQMLRQMMQQHLHKWNLFLMRQLLQRMLDQLNQMRSILCGYILLLRHQIRHIQQFQMLPFRLRLHRFRQTQVQQ